MNKFDSKKTIDHWPDCLSIINQFNVKSIIEFGCGDGTESFLNQCSKVVSVELLTSKNELSDKLKISSDYWCKYLSEKYKQYKHWNLIPVEISDNIIEAEKIVTGNNPQYKRGSNPPDSAYTKDLNDMVKNTLSNHSFDMAFVDAGIHLRGDIVNILFGLVDIIGIHDSNVGSSDPDDPNHNIYGYNRIRPPSNYKVTNGTESICGTRFYIRDRSRDHD